MPFIGKTNRMLKELNDLDNQYKWMEGVNVNFAANLHIRLINTLSINGCGMWVREFVNMRIYIQISCAICIKFYYCYCVTSMKATFSYYNIAMLVFVVKLYVEESRILHFRHHFNWRIFTLTCYHTSVDCSVKR